MSKINQTATQRVEKDGQEFLRVTMDGKDYDLPFKVLAGKKVAFLDISGQVSLNESAAKDIVDLLLEAGVEFDTILNPVAKSNALAHSIALKWNEAKGTDITKTVVARKSEGNRIQAVYRSVTTPRDQIMSLTDDDAEYIKGKKILVVDDVYGGGGTTKGLMELADKAGAIVAAHAVIAVEAGVELPEGIFYLFTLPLGE